MSEPEWPQSLAPLKELDNLLRCGICFEYFNTAMIIPQCSHNYCSLCIRKSLSFKAQCPTCCVAAAGPDLKNNRILDGLVKTFRSARQQLFQIKIKQEDNDASQEAGSTSPTGGTRNPVTPSTSATKIVPKVECPVCGVIVQEMHINKHLDCCLTRDEKKDSLRSSGHTKKFLPKLVYNLLSDRDLKKLLKEYGLSTQGTKQQLIKRHQEFVHMYNSQCDSLNPKSVAEIVKELENIEKTRAQLESSKPREDSMTFTKTQTENEIDEIHSNYRKKHKAEFKLLIDQMNKRKEHASKRNINEEPKQSETTTEKPPIETREKMNLEEQADWASITDHSRETASLDCGRSKSIDWADIGGLAPASSFQSSESSNSSSSDIIRDLEIAGMCSGSLNINSFPEMKTTKQKSQHSRSSPVFPQSKRRKN
ncbi:E3 ubiquitin-protein ligase RAD18 [Sceloporus undulatus]|uniref:E3 ubiquitin-protein ligase RAD18 n=1 Tax=Sceloporus undulatus TaxID=8520 RepID=UPI001C4B53A4|nr:E3 ubiquitin-protein ligase RAD18 [Sceloporus undulatus]